MSIQISEMRPEDAQAVFDLLQSADADSDGTEQTFEVASADEVDRLVRRFACLSLIARRDGEIVGAILFAKAADGNFTHRLAVASSASSLELAQELAGRAVRKLASRDRRVCRIGVAATVDAGAFWEAAVWDDRPVFEYGQRGRHVAIASPEPIDAELPDTTGEEVEPSTDGVACAPDSADTVSDDPAAQAADDASTPQSQAA